MKVLNTGVRGFTFPNASMLGSPILMILALPTLLILFETRVLLWRLEYLFLPTLHSPSKSAVLAILYELIVQERPSAGTLGDPLRAELPLVISW